MVGDKFTCNICGEPAWGTWKGQWFCKDPEHVKKLTGLVIRPICVAPKDYIEKCGKVCGACGYFADTLMPKEAQPETKSRAIDTLLAENERLQKQLETEQSATWDDGHELADIWRKIIEFNNKYYPNWRKTDEVYLSNALAGECGEICNMTKHRAGGGTNKRDHDDVDLLEELADLFIYMELLISTKGYTLGIFAESIRAKVKKNEERVTMIECVHCHLKSFRNEWAGLNGHCPGCGQGQPSVHWDTKGAKK